MSSYAAHSTWPAPAEAAPSLQVPEKVPSPAATQPVVAASCSHPTNNCMHEKTKVDGAELVVRRAEDEIIILPGLFISVIISGAFTPPHRPLPADPV